MPILIDLCILIGILTFVFCYAEFLRVSLERQLEEIDKVMMKAYEKHPACRKVRVEDIYGR